MSKPVSIDQSHAVVQALANNVDWPSLNPDVLQGIIKNPKDAGKQFTQFLRNGGRVIVGKPTIIPIDRTVSFSPAEFIGKDWKIAEEDERSLALAEVNLDEVCFESMLNKGEISVKGETKLERLKTAGHIRLDAKIFQTLWENQQLIPESWKEKIDGKTRYIFFDGTILLHPDGSRHVLYLYWYDGEWYWRYSWLGHDWPANDPSAVLASK
ncbi:MAG: hypothetical protein WC805_01375 [Patescibacteria group bacterium]|jgi:hypothetical protein